VGGLGRRTLLSLLLYLLVRMLTLAAGLGRPRRPTRLFLPTPWLAVGLVFARELFEAGVDVMRGPVEVVRQQWRSRRPGSSWSWEWLARRNGQRDWRQGTTAREAAVAHGLQPGGVTPAIVGRARLIYSERRQQLDVVSAGE
jgi:hypothetical protein